MEHGGHSDQNVGRNDDQTDHSPKPAWCHLRAGLDRRPEIGHLTKLLALERRPPASGGPGGVERNAGSTPAVEHRDAAVETTRLVWRQIQASPLPIVINADDVIPH